MTIYKTSFLVKVYVFTLLIAIIFFPFQGSNVSTAKSASNFDHLEPPDNSLQPSSFTLGKLNIQESKTQKTTLGVDITITGKKNDEMSLNVADKQGDPIHPNLVEAIKQPLGKFEFTVTQATDLPPIYGTKGFECEALLHNDTEGETYQVRWLFEKPMFANDVLAKFSGEISAVKQLEYQWGEHTGWYVLDATDNIETALQKFSQQHEMFLKNMIQSQNSALKDRQDNQYWKISGTDDSRQELIASFEEQLAFFESQGLLIAGIVIEGGASQVEMLLQTIENHSLSDCTVQPISKLPVEGKSSENISPNSNSPYPGQDYKFTPEHGKIQYDANDHYFLSEFLWEDASGFDQTHRAYEHDIWVWSTIDTYVRAGSGSYYTNLPAPYVDTPFSDDYAMFTIGSNWADAIETNKVYYTELPVELINLNAGPSTGGITPQLASWAGEYDDGEWPDEATEWSFCQVRGGGTDPAWCVFADQTYVLNFFNDYQSFSKFPFSYQTSATYYWQVFSEKPTTPQLVSPSNGANTSGSSITFTWKPVIASMYNLRIASDANFNNIIYDNSFSTSASYSSNISVSLDGFPDNGQTYWWQVRAYVPLGWGNWSSAWQFTNGPSAIPAVPTLQSPGNGANIAGSNVTFAWYSAARARDYQFQLALDSGFNNMVYDTQMGGTYTGLTLSGMPDDGSVFWWRVRAWNSLGWGNWSSAWQFTNGPSAIPAVPTLQSPGNGANIAGSNVTFAWYSAARARDYQFQLALDSGFNNMVYDTQMGGKYFGLTLNGLPDNGVEFWWHVRAWNSLGWSAWSSVWRFTNGPSSLPDITTLYTPMDGANIPGSSLSFQWNQTARAADYQFQIAEDNNFISLVLDTQVGGTYTGINLNGFPDNGTEFWWRVRAWNSQGWSSWSAVWRVVNGPSLPPTTPVLTDPTNGSTVSGSSISFQWGSASRAKDYQFQISSDNTFSNVSYETQLGGTYTGINLSGFPDNGTQFWWRVRAWNAQGWSNWSNGWNFINGPGSLPDIPALVSPGSGVNMPGLSIQFTWDFTRGASSYKLQLADSNVFDANTILLETDVPYPYIGITIVGFTDLGLHYWWRVQATNSLGSGDWSEPWNFINGPGIPASISGRVTEGTNPVGFAEIAVPNKRTITNSDGYYLLDNLHPGDYTVQVRKSGFTSAENTIVLSEGEVVDDFDFVIETDGSTPQAVMTTQSLSFTSTVTAARSVLSGLSSNQSGLVSRSVNREDTIVPNEYVLMVSPNVSQAILLDLESKITLRGLRILKEQTIDKLQSISHRGSRKIPSYLVVQSNDKDHLLDLLKNKDEILSITPRHYCYISEEPNDPYYPVQWGLPKIQSPLAWEAGIYGSKPKVAIVDTGIDYSHVDLVSQFGSVKGYDFVDSDPDPSPDFIYENHGTHVAGIIAASRGNNAGVVGVGAVDLLSIRALDETGRGYQDDIADAIIWATDNGAKVINLSLGGSDDPALAAAVEYAWDANVLLVAAAGNDGSRSINYPAAYERVISVGASTSIDSKASFSNYGPGLDITAPGVDIMSTLPGDDYGLLSGTSMATPFVSGVVAMMLSHDSTLTNENARINLLANTDDLGDPGWDEIYGYGRLNAYKSIFPNLETQNYKTISLENSGTSTLNIFSISNSSAWLSASPKKFTVWPNSQQDIYVTINPRGLSAGKYEDQLQITTDDPNAPILSVFVTLDVQQPTAVVLNEFFVDVGTDNYVFAKWGTASELNVVGFNLYRDIAGNIVKANDTIIPATNAGQLVGKTYEFSDGPLSTGKYRYWLEVVMTSGMNEMYGPEDAIIGHQFYLPVVVR